MVLDKLPIKKPKFFFEWIILYQFLFTKNLLKIINYNNSICININEKKIICLFYEFSLYFSFSYKESMNLSL